MFSCVCTGIPSSLSRKSLTSPSPHQQRHCRKSPVRRKKRSSRFPPYVFPLTPHASRLTPCIVSGKLFPPTAFFPPCSAHPPLKTAVAHSGVPPATWYYTLSERPPFNCRYSRNLFRKVRILIPKVLAACVRLPSWRSRVLKISSRSISQIVPLGASA